MQPLNVSTFVRGYHQVSFPNMKAVQSTIKRHKYIQDKIIADDEEERLRLLRLEQLEAERVIRDRIEQLEREKKRTGKHHDDEEARLMAALRHLEEQEIERLRLYKEWEEMNNLDATHLEHYAIGYRDLARIKDDQLDSKCDMLFGNRPIHFIPKKGENIMLEKEIERIIAQ